mmetsp:Transcript_20353/g.33561  ORF Transcript_20353/g.33561 Transcript_20353/m.33561 type:complete len:362 (-) Transcript_20353:1021-2106(-)|eukprot:CAMPEP_0203745282 /NCGR_PEP_ID=MMETSP0098-20131031/1075_1 /ASSEMBLY_ACC=CAM_ASM_000208 /TAXON_ID=96639 /ORGANISM=" , Strain NY0313808BC1" /LENGTH=361 /DNA_ID=CAMNT_0050633021 /DNA_START=217 /DNA_END=1302 /DNA_ORIENTATION=-
MSCNIDLTSGKEDAGFREPAGFEGPEKSLEVDFNPKSGCPGGMRAISREVWDDILHLARCQILTKTSNEHFDAYVLSESSLFVYDYKVFIKTCGTTTLLRCLPLLLSAADKIGMELLWLGYTRKNYIFPEDQQFPHCSFTQEIEYTKRCSGPKGKPLKGGAYVLGDLNGDHWYVYVADYDEQNVDNSERNVNIMMYGLDPSVAKQFYSETESSDAKAVTEKSGIAGLCPNAVIDDWMFQPCGYSMNALEGETFYTIHVTPESEFSYASFETNLECADYNELVEKVVNVFKPERFIITMFADESALARVKHCPTMIKSCLHRYERQTQSSTNFKDDYACRMSVYTLPHSKVMNELFEIEHGV